MDQRISWWADQLKASGAEGSRDQLRARALVDLVLGRDSRPGHAGESLAAVPAGFAGCLNLTIPAATILGLADRPGEITTMGPIDLWLARDLATAAAQNPRDHLVRDRHRQRRPRRHPRLRRRPDRKRKSARPADRRRIPLAPDARAGPSAPGTFAPGDSAPRPSPDLLLSLNPSPPTPATTVGNRRPRPRRKAPPLSRSATPAHRPRLSQPASACDYEHTVPHRRVVGRAYVMATRSAATTTASSSTPDGPWNARPDGTLAGPPRPAAVTPPNPPAIPSDCPPATLSSGSIPSGRP